MARIWVTGSSDGIGQLTARALVEQGHQVFLHARNEKRASDAMKGCPGAQQVLVADLSKISETKRVAEEANKLNLQAIIHNAGRGYRVPEQRTENGLPALFAVNSLAPYILTCLVNRPKHLVYLSSGLAGSGDGSLKDLTWSTRKSWDGFQAYCDSKLHNVLLALAVARYWPDVSSNAVDPGWVATKMGGAGAPESLQKSYETQIWLTTGKGNTQTGGHFKHEKAKSPHPIASDPKKQDEFLSLCEQLSGIPFPK